MTKWQRRQKAEKSKARKAAAVRRANLKQVVRLLVRIVEPMKEYTSFQAERKKTIQKALDILAGEAAS